MNSKASNPQVFISYSWSTPEHENFVMELATTLRTHGVDAILDKWRLKPGQDKHVFMESMVTDASVSKVLVLCDRVYKEKADKREGGVGTESQIISAELYSQVTQTKFIPVICERGDDGKEYLPVFMAGRIYVDMSSDEAWGSGLDELLRQIFEQPLYPEPSLGAVPDFLQAEGKGLPTAKELPGVLRSIRDAKANREGIETLFIRSVLAEVKKQYVTPEGVSGYDEDIHQAILNTKALRDQLSQYVDTVASFSSDDPKTLKPCILLLEQLGQLFEPPVANGSYCPGWADLYRFFALEAALIITAALIQHERWLMLKHFLKYPYLVSTDHSGPRVGSLISFDTYLVSIDEHRNHRLGLNRSCLSADLLKERCSADHTSFSNLIQADIFLGLYGVARLKASEEAAYAEYWRPRTTIYSSESRRPPVFQKAVDTDIKNGIRTAIGVASGAELARKFEKVSLQLNNFRNFSGSRFGTFSFRQAINIDVLIQD